MIRNKSIIPVLLKILSEVKAKKAIKLKNPRKQLDKFVATHETELKRAISKYWGIQADSITPAYVRASIDSFTLSDGMIQDLNNGTLLFTSLTFKPLFNKYTGLAGSDQSKRISSAIGESILFDITNDRVVNYVQNEALELANIFTSKQVESIRMTLNNGIESGFGSVKIGRNMRAAVGLTPKQTERVLKMRAQLEATKEYTAAQIDKMVERRIFKMRKFRAETIARTETSRAYNMANDESIRQALDAGVISGAWKIWRTAGDEDVRDSHQIDGEKVKIGETFSNGLEFDDEINGRCIIEYELEA